MVNNGYWLPIIFCNYIIGIIKYGIQFTLDLSWIITVHILGRRTHHPTKGSKKGDGRQWETTGDNGNKGKQEERQWETRTHMGRQWKAIGDEGRQDLGKVDTPSNTGTHVGREWETRGDKTSGRRAHQPTQARMLEDNGGQREARGDKTSGRRRHYQWETVGDKTSGRRTHHPTKETRRRQGETRPREGGHTIQHQGGHLKRALRTPNRFLFGEKSYSFQRQNRSKLHVKIYFEFCNVWNAEASPNINLKPLVKKRAFPCYKAGPNERCRTLLRPCHWNHYYVVLAYMHIPDVPNKINRTHDDKPYMNDTGWRCTMSCASWNRFLRTSLGMFALKLSKQWDVASTKKCYAWCSCNAKLLALPM